MTPFWLISMTLGERQQNGGPVLGDMCLLSSLYYGDPTKKRACLELDRFMGGGSSRWRHTPSKQKDVGPVGGTLGSPEEEKDGELCLLSVAGIVLREGGGGPF